MSIWEIERKYRVGDGIVARALLQNLRHARYTEHRVQFQRDEYYDTPANDLSTLDYTVRLRVVDGRAMVALKSPRQLSGTTYSRIELEFSGCDPDLNRAELRRSGLESRVIIEKRRTHFVGQHVTIAVDEVATLGWFCEVEGSSEDHIDEAAARAGLTGFEEVTQNYTELLRDRVGPLHGKLIAAFE